MLALDRILYPTDFSPYAEQAFEHALFLARTFKAEVHVLHVTPVPGVSPELQDKVFSEQSVEAAAQMQRLFEQHPVGEIRIVEIVQPGRSTAEVILDYELEHDIDLIVLGTHGHRRFRERLLGTVSEEVVRKSKGPVFAVRDQERPHEPDAAHRILVPVDFSENGRCGLAHAREIAAVYGAQLALMHVVEEFVPPGVYGLDRDPLHSVSEEVQSRAREEMARMARQAKRPDVEIENYIVSGHAAREIVSFAEEHDIDLIVMASHGETTIEQVFLGSVVDRVIHRAPCPVFVVKPHGKQLVA
jgi:nucleotide-binding universal stress UspA family protein